MWMSSTLLTPRSGRRTCAGPATRGREQLLPHRTACGSRTAGRRDLTSKDFIDKMVNARRYRWMEYFVNLKRVSGRRCKMNKNLVEKTRNAHKYRGMEKVVSESGASGQSEGGEGPPHGLCDPWACWLRWAAGIAVSVLVPRPPHTARNALLSRPLTLVSHPHSPLPTPPSVYSQMRADRCKFTSELGMLRPSAHNSKHPPLRTKS